MVHYHVPTYVWRNSGKANVRKWIQKMIDGGEEFRIDYVNGVYAIFKKDICKLYNYK